MALTAAAAHHHHKAKVIARAQPALLNLLLVGPLFLVVGAFFHNALELSALVCTTQKWFVFLGHTLASVPMIAKVAAINKLVQKAKKMKRVQIERSQLHKRIGIVLFLVSILF